MVFDQLLPWLNLGNYYSDIMLIISILFHLIIIEMILIFQKI
jgi:hypothetical protein